MLRLAPTVERRCCPACSDVELTFISARDGTSFLACSQCLRRFAVGSRATATQIGITALLPRVSTARTISA
jgi:hypothetical protein